MARSPNTQSPIVTRVGHTVDRLRGMNTERDPGALGPDEFVLLENVRHKGGRLVNKDGLARTNSGGAMTGTVLGVSTVVGTEAAGQGNTTVNNEARMYGAHSGGHLYSWGFGVGLSKAPIPVTSPVGSGPFGAVPYNDEIYTLCNVPQSATTTAQAIVAFAPGSSSPGRVIAVLSVLTNDAFAGGCLAVGADGNLYATTRISTAGTGASVYKWDGKTMTTEKSVTVGGSDYITATMLIPFREGIAWMVYDGTLNTGEFYTKNSAGTWSGATALTDVFSFNGAAVYKDTLYFDTGEREIYSYDGSSIATAKTLGAGVSVRNLHSYGGYLFYLTSDNKLGRYDGSTFSDSHNTDASISGTRAMWTFSGELYLATAAGKVVRSVSGATASAFTTVITGTGSDVFPNDASSVAFPQVAIR